jgi:hypothetical protein
MELAAPLPLQCPAAPEPPALLSVFLFGSTTVAIPIGDMFERGGLTNVLEDRNFFTWHLLDHGVSHCPAAPESPALLSVFLLAVPQWLFLLVTCLKEES